MMLQHHPGEAGDDRLQAMGPSNPFVTPIEYRNSLEDLCLIGGIRKSERYFAAADPEEDRGVLQAAQPARKTPIWSCAKAEADKVRAEIIKILADARVKTEDMMLKDDRERDKFEGERCSRPPRSTPSTAPRSIPPRSAALWSAPRMPPGGGGPGEPGAAGSAAPDGSPAAPRCHRPPHRASLPPETRARRCAPRSDPARRRCRRLN